ncbi:orotate phosphoribosyltransferase, partial [Bacillus cereus]
MCVKGRQGMEKWELAKEIYNTSRLTGTFKLRS